MRRLFHLASALIIAACLSACGAGSVRRIATLHPEPVDAARERIERGFAAAVQTSSQESPFWVPARLNRAGCDCPPWEVQMWGQWRRVALDWENTAVPIAANDERTADGTRLWVQVEEGDNQLVRDDGRHFLRLSVVATRPFPLAR